MKLNTKSVCSDFLAPSVFYSSQGDSNSDKIPKLFEIERSLFRPPSFTSRDFAATVTFRRYNVKLSLASAIVIKDNQIAFYHTMTKMNTGRLTDYSFLGTASSPSLVFDLVQGSFEKKVVNLHGN